LRLRFMCLSLIIYIARVDGARDGPKMARVDGARDGPKMDQ
jgi:hypothetical protein